MDTSKPAADRKALRRRLTATGAVAAWLVLLGLQGAAITRQSLIGDAAYHLLAGEQALRSGQNQLNLEHPPLVKLLAALPLLAEEPLAPPVAVDRAIATSRLLFEDPARTRRAQLRGRAVLLLAFGLPLLGCCYALGRRFGGRRAGTVLALSVGLSLAVLPSLAVIQTDTAVALGFLLTLLALLRYLERATPPRALAVGLGLGLAMAAKFSGVLLWPSVLFAVAVACRRDPGAWKRARDLMLIGLAAAAVTYAPYAMANRAYDSEIGRDTIQRYLRGEGMITGQRMQRYGSFLLALERLDPNLAQWCTGLLGIREQNAIGVYPSFAFGEVSSRGRWWYFPALLLVKTPLVLLLATVAALAAWRRSRAGPAADPDRGAWRGAALLALTAALYLGVAMTSSYNLGVRHLLPILPILYLPAAVWAARGRRRAAVLVGVLAFEAVLLAPLWMSATHTWWLGEHNPTRFAFASGNTEYHQSFLALAEHAREHRLEPLDVLYPLLAEEELRAYLPEARLATPGEPLQRGRWVAVNVIVEQYLPAIRRASAEELRGHGGFVALARDWTPLWEQVRQGEDHGYAAGTFHVYYLPP